MTLGQLERRSSVLGQLRGSLRAFSLGPRSYIDLYALRAPNGVGVMLPYIQLQWQAPRIKLELTRVRESRRSWSSVSGSYRTPRTKALNPEVPSGP